MPTSAYDCAKGADALVIVTEWEQFRALDLAALKTAMAKPVIVDLRNIYPPEEMAKHGFTYTGVGRGLSESRSSLAERGRVACVRMTRSDVAASAPIRRRRRDASAL